MRPAAPAAAGEHCVGTLHRSRPTPAAWLPRSARCRRSAGSAAAAAQANSHFSPACTAWQRSCGVASTSGRVDGAPEGGALRHRQKGTSWRTAAAASADGPQDGASGTAQADWQAPDEEPAVDGDDEMTEEQALEMEAALEALTYEYVEYCRERFEIEDLVEIGLGVNDLPAVYLHHPNGSELEVYLHGANITSWRKKDGAEVLFLRPGNTFDGVSPIQGGIPVAFPQYGRGVLPTNGILRRAHWSVADTGRSDPALASDPAPSVALWTESDESTLAVWPHKFEAMYTISLMENDDFPDVHMSAPEPEKEEGKPAEAPTRKSHAWEQRKQEASDAEYDFEGEAQDTEPTQLRCVLEIMNTDDREFTFTSALQTHFAVRALGEWPDNSRFVKILGLGGKRTLDYAVDPMHPRLGNEEKDYVQFGEEPVDRLYVDTDETDVKLCPGDRTHHEIINRRGFRDTGAFNPHERVPDAWRHFVSVPSARVARPITLQPGGTWTGEMVIRSFDSMWERPLFEFDKTEETEGDEEDATTEAPPPTSEIPQPRPTFPETYP